MRRATSTIMASCIALGAAGPVLGAGETITVDIALNDTSDFGGAQTVADLPGPDGKISLREAVTAANNTPGPQTIAFAIPTSEWSIFADDRAIIMIENMIYVSGADTTLDFSTQTAFTGDTNPDGNECGIAYFGPPASIPGLWIASDRCVVKGLDVGFGNNFGNTVWVTGNDNRVIGCTTSGMLIRGDYGGGDRNVIGGTSPGEGNTFSEWVGITSSADDNIVVGNFFGWGLSISGDTYWGTCDNTRVGGPTDAERNTLSGHGYYGEEGFPLGTQLAVAHARNTVIENNFIGTTTDGTAKYPGRSGTGGISVYTGAVGTVIRNNLISGIAMAGTNHYQGQRFGIAIGVGATAAGTVITGNRLGVGADGTPIANVQGVSVQSDPNGDPTNTTLGGASLEEGNIITASEKVGVTVSFNAAGVRISGNSIFDNGALGIDLVTPAGVTPNDAGDADSGANGLQNFPVITSAGSTGALARITGTLNSATGSVFDVEFFSSPVCDPSGYGEGRTYLGTVAVATDALGWAEFAVNLPAPLAAGEIVTATATHAATGNTSEFSACATVIAVCPADIDLNGFVSGEDFDTYGAWFVAGGSAADFDANGFVNGEDFDAFVAAFVVGC